MSDETTEPREDGFEYKGRFYRWHISDLGKDLMLIDRLSGLSVYAFFELVEDDHDLNRIPVLLTMIATSLRNGHPDWSVERIVRTVETLSLSDIAFIDADAEEEPMRPPPAGETEPTGSDTSPSTGNGSSSSSVRKATSTSKT